MTVAEEIRIDSESGSKRLEREYKAGLMAFARRFCADESDAEELVYHTFSEVVASIGSYTPLSRKIRDKLSRTSIRANKDRGK